MELKNKYHWIFIILLMSIFIISFVSAQQPNPPQQNININIGLQIEFTQVDIIQNGKPHLFNAHVFNISTGQRVTNITTDCNFHLFDNLGEHQIDQVPMVFDSLGLDFEHNVTGNNFTRNGDYSFLVVCNSTSGDVGGFLSKGIKVTQNGQGIDEGKGIILFGIILILITITIFFLIATIYIQNLPFKVFLGSLSVLMLVSTMGFGVTIMQQIFGEFTNLISAYGLFFNLFLILLGGAGIGLILFLVVFGLRMFNKSRGTIE